MVHVIKGNKQQTSDQSDQVNIRYQVSSVSGIFTSFQSVLIYTSILTSCLLWIIGHRIELY